MGTKEGAAKATKAIYKKFGKRYFKDIGRRGGLARVPKGFSMDRELASRSGHIGGLKSRRTK